jgi:putative phosphoesterase
MLIGLLSDSHGRADMAAQAVGALAEHGVGMLLHLGDVGSEDVLDELAGHNARVVFGNCDWDIESLSRHAGLLEVQVDHPMGIIDVDGHVIAFTHGHIGGLMEQAVSDGVDYLCHGHLHAVRDDRVGRTRVISPGALSRATRYTCAVLDPARDAVRWLEIARPPTARAHG